MKNTQQPISLRIHGDNIIECERGLHLIAHSFSANIQQLISSPYMPQYEIIDNGSVLFEVELLAGHGRWGVNIQEVFQSYGAPLREAADAIITRVLENEQSEELLLALEFSSALPAGNNAWQRSGRALACAMIGVPYLYFTEIGGVELDRNRAIKATRFPNPIVPFSYLAASKDYGVLCLPVYEYSPASSKDIYTRFYSTIGVKDANQIIRYIIEEKSYNQLYQNLVQRVMNMVEILADSRRQVDTLRGSEWSEFLGLERGIQKAIWLEEQQKEWKKKRAGKVEITKTFRELLKLFQMVQTISVGASTIPICLLSVDNRGDIAMKISELYGNSIDPQFVKWLASKSPLVVVWITGFKPRGDDSRPDRGLVPLARMLFGNEIEILSIVSGPAKPQMWTLLQKDAKQLAKQNGLWETIVHLSNAVLVDSPTLSTSMKPLTQLLTPVHIQHQGRIRFPIASPITKFSEHDVDSVIHLLFSSDIDTDVFESMCNPPGGDWSGISLLNFLTRDEFRWTSLPRVSHINGKRPDHIIQFNLETKDSVLLIIESKNLPSNIRPKLGPRLTAYVEQLIETPPTSVKKINSDWKLWKTDDLPLTSFSTVSGGAFCWTKESDLVLCLNKCEFDIVMAIEFNSLKQSALLHILVKPSARFLLPIIRHLAQRFRGRLKIQVH